MSKYFRLLSLTTPSPPPLLAWINRSIACSCEPGRCSYRHAAPDRNEEPKKSTPPQAVTTNDNIRDSLSRRHKTKRTNGHTHSTHTSEAAGLLLHSSWIHVSRRLHLPWVLTPPTYRGTNQHLTCVAVETCYSMFSSTTNILV